MSKSDEELIEEYQREVNKDLRRQIAEEAIRRSEAEDARVQGNLDKGKGNN